MSPILIYRLNLHLSLGAHWLILASIFLDVKKSENVLIKKILLIVFSSLVHLFHNNINIYEPFFSFLIINKDLHTIFLKKIFSIFVFDNCNVFVGYFHIPATDALGFGYGYYKTNFLSLSILCHHRSQMTGQ